MNFLLTTVGSRGDVQPMVALALGLRRAGHAVKLCATSNGRALAGLHQLEFIDLGADIETLLKSEPELVQKSALGSIPRLRKMLLEAIDLQFAVHTKEMPWADVSLGAGLVNAPCSVAAAFHKPYRFAVYCAQAIPSKLHAPYTIAMQGAPGWVNQAFWAANDLTLKLMAGAAMSKNRIALGLSAVDRVSQVITPPGQLIFAADPEMSEPPLDYDPDIPITGPWILPVTGAIDPEVASFIEAGSKPVYIGFGSMTDGDAAATTRLILEAAERAKVRLLISSGWAGLGGGALPENCKILGEAPHALLFPKLAGVVHHGGAGTVSTAARAGIPQLLIPHLMDQHYWAYRLERKGLGPKPILRRKLNVESLAHGLQDLVTNKSYIENAERFAIPLRARDGVSLAVSYLERLAGA